MLKLFIEKEKNVIRTYNLPDFLKKMRGMRFEPNTSHKQPSTLSAKLDNISWFNPLNY